MSIFLCEAFFEDIPILDEVKHAIFNIVGLAEIENRKLEPVVEKNTDVEKDAANGLMVVPPKPFHMVFIKSNGTRYTFDSEMFVMEQVKGGSAYGVGTYGCFDVPNFTERNNKHREDFP